ncbi:MAG: hypothetical protein GEV09_09495 [Pseudonocardiaceae bacterium]|nr:hypothetical protein [Pseudonocardiaceae bacterium]
MHASARRRHLPAVAAFALALAAAGCGSQSEDPSADAEPVAAGKPVAEPVQWAGTFCGGLGEVVRSAQAIGAPPSDPQAHKAALLDVADSLQQSLDATASKLSQLGAPDVPDGARTQQIVLDFFGAASDATAAQREQLAALDPQGSDFDERLGAIVSDGAAGELDSRMAEVTSKPELAPAFRSAPECRQMAGAPR